MSKRGWWNNSISQLITREQICHKFFVFIVTVFLATRTKLSLVHTLTIVCKIRHYSLDEFPIPVLVCNLSSPAFLVQSNLHMNNNSPKIIHIRCLRWYSQDSRIGGRAHIHHFQAFSWKEFWHTKNVSSYSVLNFSLFLIIPTPQSTQQFCTNPKASSNPNGGRAGLHHGYIMSTCLTCNLYFLCSHSYKSWIYQ